MEQEIIDAREKLKARFGNPTQIGGKGTILHLLVNFAFRISKKKEEAC
jgi:hypothetical protein